MSSAGEFVRLSRSHFLLGGVLMYGIGVAAGGGTTVGRFVAGQLMVTAAQITAHYVNEYCDVEADRLVQNRTLFSGGSGVLASNSLAPQVAMRAALLSSALALMGAALVAPVSVLAAVLGVVALTVSWAYSMPPIRLLDTGWGELATSVVVTVVVPLIGVSITGASSPDGLVWAMAVLLPVHLAMMLVFEIPDVMTDRMAGKTVLAVRLGEPRTILLILVLYVFSAVIALVGGSGSAGAGGGIVVAVVAAIGVWALFSSIRRRAFGWATTTGVALFAFLGSTFLVSWLGN